MREKRGKRVTALPERRGRVSLTKRRKYPFPNNDTKGGEDQHLFYTEEKNKKTWGKKK